MLITSRVDVAAFRRTMADEPFTAIHRMSQQEGMSVYWFEILHRTDDGSVLVSQGELDTSSGEFRMRSSLSETLTTSATWHRMTNERYIDFTFDFEERKESAPKH